MELIGRVAAIGPWNQNAELAASLITGIGFGLLGSWVVNRDRLHAFLRRKGVSQRSSQPSEWCDVLSKYPMFVTLHFKDERRLFGWPEVWPSDPEKGHFFIVFPSWTHETEPRRVEGVEGILVSVAEVRFVEFVPRKEGTS